MHTSRAITILVHYFKTLYQDAGLGWTTENTTEIHELIDEIVDAAVESALAEAERNKESDEQLETTK